MLRGAHLVAFLEQGNPGLGRSARRFTKDACCAKGQLVAAERLLDTGAMPTERNLESLADLARTAEVLRDGGPVRDPSGRSKATSGEIIGEQLFSLVDDLGRRKLLLNFGNVEYLSSAALSKLITLNKKLQQVGGKLILCNIDANIREVFEITRLNKVFSIFPDEEAGLGAFK